MGNAGSVTVLSSENQILTDDDLQEIFKNYDKDESGSIDCTELGAILENLLLIKPSESSLKDLIADVDINKDGSLQFAEFQELVKKFQEAHPVSGSDGTARVSFGNGSVGLGLLPSSDGLKVTECSGIAESAGVNLGDIIVELQGEKLPVDITLQEFAERVAKLQRPIVIGFSKAEAAPADQSKSLLFFCACDDSR